MKLLLATSSTKKSRYLQNVVGESVSDVKIETVTIMSAVSDQPNSFDERLEGAMYRAKQVYLTDSCGLGVGIEDGMKLINQYWEDHLYDSLLQAVVLPVANQEHVVIDTVMPGARISVEGIINRQKLCLYQA